MDDVLTSSGAPRLGIKGQDSIDLSRIFVWKTQISTSRKWVSQGCYKKGEAGLLRLLIPGGERFPYLFRVLSHWGGLSGTGGE